MSRPAGAGMIFWFEAPDSAGDWMVIPAIRTAEHGSDTLFAMALDKSQPEALRRLPFVACAICRGRSLPELWRRPIAGISWNCGSRRRTTMPIGSGSKAQNRADPPIKPIPTDVYLHITLDGRRFSQRWLPRKKQQPFQGNRKSSGAAEDISVSPEDSV